MQGLPLEEKAALVTAVPAKLKETRFQNKLVWCGVVWCGVVWCGVMWCGVVGWGVVWCGVVWCGAVVTVSDTAPIDRLTLCQGSDTTLYTTFRWYGLL